MSDPTLTVDGKPTPIHWCQVSEGPNVFEGYDLKTGTTLRQTKPFEGARQTQQSFDFAEVQFLGREMPTSATFVWDEKTYDLLMSIDGERSLTSDAAFLTVKLGAAA